MKNCPECNSEKIVRDAKTNVQGDGTQLRVAVDENPNALIIKKRSFSDLKVDVCSDCGFVKFFAKDPNKLWIAYQNQRNKV